MLYNFIFKASYKLCSWSYRTDYWLPLRPFEVQETWSQRLKTVQNSMDLQHFWTDIFYDPFLLVHWYTETIGLDCYIWGSCANFVELFCKCVLYGFCYEVGWKISFVSQSPCFYSSRKTELRGLHGPHVLHENGVCLCEGGTLHKHFPYGKLLWNDFQFKSNVSRIVGLHICWNPSIQLFCGSVIGSFRWIAVFPTAKNLHRNNKSWE